MGWQRVDGEGREQLGSVQAKSARNYKERTKNALCRTKLQKLNDERTRNAFCISGLL